MPEESGGAVAVSSRTIGRPCTERPISCIRTNGKLVKFAAHANWSSQVISCCPATVRTVDDAGMVKAACVSVASTEMALAATSVHELRFEL